MKMKLLVLGASRYYQKSIEALKNYGYKVYAIDMNEDSQGFNFADGYRVIDITNKEKALEYAKEININGVIPLNDFGIQTAAFINENLSLNGINIKTGEVVTNKAQMRQAWKKSGAPIPKFFVSDSYFKAKEELNNLKFPIIVKPSDSRGGGSRGVKVVFSVNKFEDAFKFAQSFYVDKNVIVEECVVGSEHSLEIIVINSKAYILAVSEKVKTPYPYRVDKQVIYPANLTNRQFFLVQDTVQKAIDGVGIINGTAHIELTLTEKGPILFEIGARPGGGATPQIVEAISGIEYLKLSAKIATGETISIEELKPNFIKSSIYHFFIFEPTNNKIKTIKGLEKISNLKEIIDFELFIKKGDVIKEVQEGKDRQGFAIVVSDDREKAIKYANFINQNIKFEFES